MHTLLMNQTTALRAFKCQASLVCKAVAVLRCCTEGICRLVCQTFQLMLEVFHN